MIRLTDITLSAVEAFGPSREQLLSLYRLLLDAPTDFIEMSAEVYRQLGRPSGERIVLRIVHPADAQDYPDIRRFVCRKSGVPAGSAVTQEIQINDVREISFLGKQEPLGNVRLIGLDDILIHDYESLFTAILKRVGGRAEFCPENSCHVATAAAVEWVSCGGQDVAAAFGGLGGKASLEEIILALRLIRRHKPTASYTVFPLIALLLEEITKARFSPRKPVIGRSIFDVESGIHVDGILKKPQMYEPYLPELVGSSRRILVGKYSGRKAIAAKLGELGLEAEEYDVAQVLADVREASIGKNSSLSAGELLEIAGKYKNKG